MPLGPYDPDVYRRFAENLRGRFGGPNIEHVSMRALRRKAVARPRSSPPTARRCGGRRSRRALAAKTVYLGDGPEIVLPRATPAAGRRSSRRRRSSSTRCCSSCAPCRSSTSAGRWATTPSSTRSATSTCPSPTPRTTGSPTSGARTMGDVKRNAPRPRVHDDRHPAGAPAADADPHHPRARHQHRARLRLHRRGQEGVPAPGDVPRRPARHARACTPAPRSCTPATPARGKLKSYAVFMFGLTATGKSTWSCHQLGLDPDAGEGTWVARTTSSCCAATARRSAPSRTTTSRPTSRCEMQEAMYRALAHQLGPARERHGRRPRRDRLHRRAARRERPRRARPHASSRSSAARRWSRSAPTRSTHRRWRSSTASSSRSSPGATRSCRSPSA